MGCAVQVAAAGSRGLPLRSHPLGAVVRGQGRQPLPSAAPGRCHHRPRQTVHIPMYNSFFIIKHVHSHWPRRVGAGARPA